MKLDLPDARDRGERLHEAPVIPMINVVFLLLIFFMMTAVLAPPDPVETIPPVSSSEDEGVQGATLYIAADGRLARGDLRGEAVFGGLSGAGSVVVKADAGASASRLAEVLARLRGAGVEDVTLLVEAR